MRITCVGAGPAGLYFSILAALQGHEVAVLERLERSGSEGWGITMAPALIDTLRSRDAESAERIAADAIKWKDLVVEVQGQGSKTFPLGNSLGFRRGTLCDALVDRARAVGVDVRYGQPVDDPDSLEGHDLLVGADGVNSVVRSTRPEAFGTRIESARNKFVWLGADHVRSCYTYSFARTPEGWMWAAFHPIDATTSSFSVETTPETWQAHGFEDMDVPTTLERLREIFAEPLEGNPLRAQPRADGRIGWQSMLRVTNERWCVGNAVLLGDAAHNQHGGGTMLALGDAIALADELAAQPDAASAISAYGARRAAEIRPRQKGARIRLQWFDRIPQIIAASPQQIEAPGGRFADLLWHRESPWQARMSPTAYLRLLDAVERFPGPANLVRGIRRLARAAIRRVRG